jgi:hypothetical protein
VLVTFSFDADWSLFDHVQMQQELASIVVGKHQIKIFPIYLLGYNPCFPRKKNELNLKRDRPNRIPTN